MNMKIAVISDLHIGPIGPTHQLGHSDDEFCEFLDRLEESHDKIILLGDIFETLMPLVPGQFDQSLQECLWDHPKLVDRFNGEKYVYVAGNHDEVSETLLNAHNTYSILHKDTAVIFAHGHQFDLIMKHAKWLATTICWLGGIGMRIGLKKVYQTISEKAISHAFSFDKTKSSFQRRAVDYAREKGFDIIVTGHTHMPTINDHGDVIFMNSGTCTFSRICYLSLDLEKDQYKICRIT